MKVILAPAVTVDGFLADLNGDCYSWISPADEARYNKKRREIGCELVGRKTYEQYKDSYDTQADATIYVYTSRTSYADSERVKFIGGDIHMALARIESDGFVAALVSGGGELNGMLASAGVLSEIFLSYHPLTLGEGIPLFGSYSPRLTLELLSLNQDAPGIVQHHYRVVTGQSL